MEQTLLLAPLAGAVVAGLLWRLIGETAARWTATALMLIAAALAWLLAVNAPDVATVRYLHTWIESGSLSAALAFRLDRSLAPLLVLVTNLSALVHIVALTRLAKPEVQNGSGKYVAGQEARLCAGLGLLTFAMILLIVADDMAQFLAGWIATGFASYLLSGLFIRKPAACKAALRVGLTLRAGEIALIVAVIFLFSMTDTIRFDDIFQAVPDLDQTRVQIFVTDWSAIELIAICLVLASLVMAAQLVFFGWAFDAAEAPLPGAILVMTTGPLIAASVLLMRMGAVLDQAPLASDLLVVAAIATTVIASSSAIAQSNPVRVIACLASAQAGLVLAALGLGAHDAAMMQLLSAMTALAVLALAIGLARGRGEEPRDLDRLGGCGRAVPLLLVSSAFAAASLSALGVPGSGLGLSGFLSSQSVFAALAAAPSPEWLWAVATAFIFCSLAAWRLVLRVFVFAPRVSDAEADQSPVGWLVTVPLFLVAVTSAGAGMLLSTTETSSAGGLVVLFGLVGLGLAALIASRGAGLSRTLKTAVPLAHNALVNGWHMSSILRLAVASPLVWITAFLARGQSDEDDQRSQTGTLGLAPVLAQQANRFQGGLLAGYGVAFAVGVLVLIVWIVLMSGAS